MIRRTIKQLLPIAVLIILSWWSIKPLFNSGFFPMHDDTQVARVVAMGKALRDGQFPVRWVSDLGYGYGYPIFNFYSPLPYYAGGFFYLLGLEALTATKLMFGLGILLAALAMYALGASFFGPAGGLIAGLFYTFTPYHAVQIYVRGAVGEFWALVFWPILFLGLWWASTASRKVLGIVVGSIGIAGVILSHTILGYLTTLLTLGGILVFWLVAKLRRQNFSFRPRLLLLLFGLGVSAFFWLPAVSEMRFTAVQGQIGASANFRDHFVCWQQLWNSSWGYGGSAPGCIDGMSFKLGKLHVLIASLAFIFWLIRGSGKRFSNSAMTATAGLVMLSIFLMTSASEQLWEIVPLAAYIQYPWRFLALAGFGLALLAASLAQIWQNRLLKWATVALLTAGVVVVNAKWFAPQYSYWRPSQEFETETELKYNASRISDEYLPRQINRPQDASGIVRATIYPTSSLRVFTEVDRGIYARFALFTASSQEITIHRAYFPGWRYWVNGASVDPAIVAGLPRIVVPSGESVVEARFTNTPIRTVGNLLSLISLGLLLFIYDKKAVA